MICGPPFVSPCALPMLRAALRFCVSSHVQGEQTNGKHLLSAYCRPGTMRSAYMHYLSKSYSNSFYR